MQSSMQVSRAGAWCSSTGNFALRDSALTLASRQHHPLRLTAGSRQLPLLTRAPLNSCHELTRGEAAIRNSTSGESSVEDCRNCRDRYGRARQSALEVWRWVPSCTRNPTRTSGQGESVSSAAAELFALTQPAWRTAHTTKAGPLPMRHLTATKQRTHARATHGHRRSWIPSADVHGEGAHAMHAPLRRARWRDSYLARHDPPRSHVLPLGSVADSLGHTELPRVRALDSPICTLVMRSPWVLMHPPRPRVRSLMSVDCATSTAYRASPSLFFLCGGGLFLTGSLDSQ